MKRGVGGSQGTGHVGCWRMRSIKSFRKHFMLVLNTYFKIRTLRTQRRVTYMELFSNHPCNLKISCFGEFVPLSSSFIYSNSTIFNFLNLFKKSGVVNNDLYPAGTSG